MLLDFQPSPLHISNSESVDRPAPPTARILEAPALQTANRMAIQALNALAWLDHSDEARLGRAMAGELANLRQMSPLPSRGLGIPFRASK